MNADGRKMSRARILTGATEILDGGVYGDLTVDALARSLHMSKSTLYKYFASKEDVIVALIDQACSGSEALLDEGKAANSVEALEHVVDVIATFADRLPRAAILQQRRLPSASQDRIELTIANLGSAFRDQVARGVKGRKVSFKNAPLAAASFMAGARAAMEAAARGEVSGKRSDAVKEVWDLVRPGMIA